MVKVSIILQYRRIFTTPGMQKATAVALVIIVAWGIACISMFSTICTPIQKLWEPSRAGRCIPLLVAYYVPAAINTATDFGTWILPLPIIKRLQLPKRQKYILMFVFGLGFL